ncbi:type II secretion system ATPase GspE [Enterobacter cloacae]|uniref:type II secretion system ATPase GspE n=1 Tax=Enterobacter cloacae TaxID=550 RepID=UPI00101AFCD4|nr:type II secretion system ATPase GspE [Enterobacter cloacae]QBC03371.1 type II secretion system protein GspE [Enterobacter cloacae]
MEEPLLPFAWAQQHGVLYRFWQEQHQLVVRSNTTFEALLEARRILPPCRLLELDDVAFEQALLNCYQQNSGRAKQIMEELGNEVDFYQVMDALPQSDDLLDSEDGAPIIRMINAMLAEAIKEGASDVHIEPFEQQLSIRFRIDGVLRTILTPQRQLAPVLVSRLKVMAKLDITEKRLPQDGRMALRIAGRSIDVRVSTLPTRFGERVVLRLLDKNGLKLELRHLGMDGAKRQNFEKLIGYPHGIILVTGPTGSGKSTTLYAALNQMNRRDRNIMTVEDPIEYELEGVGQTQVNPRVDMTFARGLRAILRQDPDVLMIGEIRDSETAQIAVQASLTGHLVLSTLHTNSAIGAIGRLRDMGIEPFLLASSLLGVIAQRLVRTLCPHCRRSAPLDSVQLAQLQLSLVTAAQQMLYHPVGCEHCNGSGYRGRTGIHELLPVNDVLRDAIARGENETTLEQLCRDTHCSIRQDGLEKVLSGQTSLEEVLRVTREN